jgi:hypothetical protein
MLDKNDSPQKYMTGHGIELPDGSVPSHDFRFKAIILAFVAVSVVMGLFFNRIVAGNIIVAIAIASFLLLIFVGADYRRGWVILILVSTISAIKVNYGAVNIRPDQVVFMWVLFVWLGSFAVGKVRLHHTPLLIPVVGTLAVNLLFSFWYSPNKGFSYQSCVLLAIYLLMYILTVNILGSNVRLLRSTPLLLVVVGVFQAMYGLVAVAVNSAGIDIKGITVTSAGVGVAASGGFEEANLLAAYVSIVALILLAHISLKSEWQRRGPFIYISLGILLMALLLTYTRAAWIGFVLSSLCLMVLIRPSRNIINPRSLALLLGLAAVFIVVGVPLGNYIATSTGGEQGGLSDRISNLTTFSEGSGEGRAEIETIAINRWKEDPLLGRGTFSMPMTELTRTAQGGWLYSSIVQSLHDTGLLGAIFLVWIYVGGVIIGIKGYMKSSTRFWKATLGGGTLGWVALAVAAQASSSAWLAFSWIYLGLLVSWSENIELLESGEYESI